MKIERIAVAGERGVRASVRPRGVTAMFGKNGSGKTNFLDLIAEVLTMDPSASRPTLERHSAVPDGATVTVTAEDFREGSADSQALRNLLQYGHLSVAEGSWPPTEVYWFGGNEAHSVRELSTLDPLSLAEVRYRYATELVELSNGMMTASLARQLVSGRGFHLVMYEGVYITAPPARDWSPEDRAGASWLREDLKTPAGLRRVLNRALSRPDDPAIILEVSDDAPGALSELFSVWDFRAAADQRSLLEDEAGWLYDAEPEAIELVNAVATKVAPPFVRQHYNIEVSFQPLAIHAIEIGTGRRFPAELLGRGTAVWIEAAVRLAVDVHASILDGVHPPPVPWITFVADGQYTEQGRTPVLIFDEPERHLHPTAQVELTSWLAGLSRGGAHVLVATHSPRLLSYPTEDVRLVGIERSSRTQLTRARPLSRVLAGANEALMESLGLDPIDTLMLLRAVLVVEGEHDVRFMAQKFGHQLADAGVLVLPLHGHSNALTTPDLELLTLLQLPVAILLDRATQQEVVGTPPDGRVSDEGRTLRHLRRRYQAAGLGDRFLMVEHGLPDILAAIADDAVSDALGINDWPGWQVVLSDHESAKKRGEPVGNFKSYAARRGGIEGPKAGSRLAAQLLTAVDSDTPVAPAAGHLLKQVLGQVGVRIS